MRNKRFATLDNWFSKYIRLRDTDEDGIGRCCTCGRIKPFYHLDAGHFVSRDKKNTRFDERNVHAQCHHCNRFKDGMPWEHGRFIDNKYGEGSAEQIKIRGHFPRQFKDWEIKEMRRIYREKARKLYKEKSHAFRANHPKFVK